jgi:acyl dehydratase
MAAKPTTHYDDIEIGMNLPETELLLTVPVLQRWCSATETLRRDHYDTKYSIEHDGISSAVLSGSFSQAYIWGLLFNWVGGEGWVYKVYQKNAAMVHPGDTVTFTGLVTNKYVKDGLGYVELDIGLRKEDGSLPIPGNATVVLPLKGGRPVPYPFKP